jgi:hypothetical protein
MAESLILFDRFITRPRSLGIRLLVLILLYGGIFLAAALDSALSELWNFFILRVLLLAPTVSIYIWLVAPIMVRYGHLVVNSLRPVINLEDEEFEQLYTSASGIKPAYEIMTFVGGFLLGTALTFSSGFEQLTPWLGVYWLLTAGLMYGLLLWVILVSVLNTRLISKLHQNIGDFDILDPSPFEPVGKQSLLLALVFIGGISISFLFSFRVANLSTISFWIEYGVLVLFVLLIFFLNMRPTYRVMAAQKNKELASIRDQIYTGSRELQNRLEKDQPAGELPEVIQALAVFEGHLQTARTWPYNTSMLRALVFSVLIPLLSVLARVLVELIR